MQNGMLSLALDDQHASDDEGRSRRCFQEYDVQIIEEAVIHPTT